MFIIDATPRGQSWYPINHMVRLASRLFDADVTQVSSRKKPPIAARIGSTKTLWLVEYRLPGTTAASYDRSILSSLGFVIVAEYPLHSSVVLKLTRP